VTNPRNFNRFMARQKADRRDWYRITNKKDDTARIDVYDAIGYDPWWDEGIAVGDFAKEVRAIKASKIELHINSPGGAAFDGVTMYNAVRDHPAFVEVTVDGLAASAASVLAMSGDEIIMNRASELMIHDASGMCWGNADDMAETGAILDRLSADIAAIYADRAGGTVTSWRDAMREETWYSANEAVEAGLAHHVVELKEDATEAKNRFDLRIFAHAGRSHAPAPKLRAANSGFPRDNVPANDEVVKPEDGMTPEQLEVIGLPEDATEEQISERLAELIASADTPAGGDEPNPDEGGEDEPGKPEPENAPDEDEVETPTTTQPEGTVLVDAAALAQLQASAARSDELFEKERVRTRDALLNSAVQAGKIAPARLRHWKAQYDADPEGITKVVNELPEVIPVKEIGHGGDGGDSLEASATEYPTQYLTAAEKARIKQAQEA
jgi:ATP-dependent protease ClpP protease subunit